MAERINQRRDPLIGRNLIRLREREHKKASDVLKELDLKGIHIKSGAYSKIENGGNNPTVEMLIALTDILHCSPDDFFTRD